MKDLQDADRPREKLARAGPGALGDNELVALVLGSGTRTRSALELAREVLKTAGGADGLLRLELDELRGIGGVGAARAARLLAAMELGRRALVRQAGDRPQFRTPQDLALYLMPLHSGHRVERFGGLLLDSRLRLIRSAVIASGTADGVTVEPRDLFREALLASATHVVAFHNHPSGDPSPSSADRVLTARLRDAGRVLGITLLDHVILGAGRFFSFKAETDQT
ncbi:MAG TPA: DNA repair protein RadC [Vicinamibacterales bacterium]|nr:DNA repair protein RadC [Vicinamibacterales bacterium]